jgi:predicted kinase
MATLYLMLGYPGAGKTTTAKIVSHLTGAQHLWADHERRRRLGRPTYTHQENIKLYNMLNKEAEHYLQSGESLIYDTNFNFYKDREKMRRVAAGHGVDTIVLWVTTDKDTAQHRAVHDDARGSTRVLGNMPLAHFERIARNLQPPRADEKVIKLDGTKITEAYVREKLGL